MGYVIRPCGLAATLRPTLDLHTLMLFRKQQRASQRAGQTSPPQGHTMPEGWHDGRLTMITIQRRQGRRTFIDGKRSFQPSGWDLVDSYTGHVIAEFNDETSLPPKGNRPWNIGQSRDKLPQDGNELGEMFKAIYTIANDALIEAMQLMGTATPEHEDSRDGEPIAMLTISAYTNLSQSVPDNRVQAFRQGWDNDVPAGYTATSTF